jgi:hypothetical protein
MAKTRLGAIRGQEWPPESLKKYIAHMLERDPTMGRTYQSALERLLMSTNINVPEAYRQLCKKYEPPLIGKYLEEVCNVYLDIEYYHPIRDIKYTKWLAKISQESELLSNTIHGVPSPDLILPEGLSNVDSLLLFLLDRYGDEITHEEYLGAGQQLRRSLQRVPVHTLLRELAVLAGEEKSKPRTHYWENELGIKVSRKQGSRGDIVREQILIKVIKKLTRGHFKAPHHDLVATLVNTLMDSEKHTADSVSKTPK